MNLAHVLAEWQRVVHVKRQGRKRKLSYMACAFYFPRSLPPGSSCPFSRNWTVRMQAASGSVDDLPWTPNLNTCHQEVTAAFQYSHQLHSPPDAAFRPLSPSVSFRTFPPHVMHKP